MKAYSIDLWIAQDDLRCVIRPWGNCWQLSLMRRRSDVKVELFADAAGALSAADEWRRAIDRPEERLVEGEFEA